MASPNWIQCDFIQVNPRWIDSTCFARSKDYSIGGIPIPFEPDRSALLDRLYERRRQQLHEDQIVTDVIVQAVTSRLLQ